MPIYSVQGPDGRIYDVEGPAGASEEQIVSFVRANYQQLKPKEGIGAAVGKGIESLISSGRTAFGALTGSPEEAAQAGLERGEAISKKYADQVSLEKVKEAYEKRGLLSAAGEAVSQVPAAIAEQAPNLAATFGTARAGAALGSLAGPVGTVVGGLAGAALPSLFQQFGGNVERQALEQKARGEQVKIDTGAAGAAALPQAALDVAGNLIPLGGRLVSKLTGIPEKALLGKSAEQATKLADEKLLKVLAKGTATGALAEIPTEIAQQMLERAQAGLSLSDASALKEYGETAYQVGLLAPLGAAGRLSERAGARGEVIVQKQEEARKLREEETKKAQEEAAKLEAYKQSDEYLDNLQQKYSDYQTQFADLMAKAKAPTEATDFAGIAAKQEARKQLAELKQSEDFKNIGAEYKAAAPRFQDLAKRKAEDAEKARIAGMSPEEYAIEQAKQQQVAGVSGKAKATDVGIESPFAPPPGEADKYIQQRMVLAQQQAPEQGINGIADYLMADPLMARHILENRIQFPLLVEPQKNKAKQDRAQNAAQEVIYYGIQQQLAELEKKRAAAGRAATGVAQQRLSTVESEEQAALDAQRAEEARLAEETARRDQLAPEVAALQGMATKPSPMTDQFSIFGNEPTVQGTAAMGQAKQKLLGEDVTATAEENAADIKRDLRRVPGAEFKLRARKEGTAPVTREAVADRLNRVLSTYALSPEASAFLRRAEQVMPQAGQDYFDLLDAQLDRIESGQEGVPRKGQARTLTAPAAPTAEQQAQASTTPGTEGAKIDMRERRDAFPGQPSPLKTTIAQPDEAERTAGLRGRAEQAVRTPATRATTLRGESAQALDLSLQNELEPLVRQSERIVDEKAGQLGLFPEEEKKLGYVKPDREAFNRFMRSPFVNKLRKDLRANEETLKQAARIPALKNRVNELTTKIIGVLSDFQEYKTADKLVRANKDITVSERGLDQLKGAMTKNVVGRMELAGAIESLQQQRAQFLEESQKTGIAPDPETLAQIDNVEEQMQRLSTDLSLLDGAINTLDGQIRVAQSQSRMMELVENSPSLDDLQSSREQLRAAQTELADLQSRINALETEKKAKAAEDARAAAAVAAAERAKATEALATKASEAPIQGARRGELGATVVPAMSWAERVARRWAERGKTPISVTEKKEIQGNPEKVLGGFKALVTGLEKKINQNQLSAKRALETEVVGPALAARDKLDAQYKAAKSSAERAQIGPRLDAAESALTKAREEARKPLEEMVWKSKAGDTKKLAEAMRKVDWLENLIAEGRVEIAPPKSVQVISKKTQEILTAESKAKAQAAAAERAEAPATSGEALTRTQAKQAAQPKKTQFEGKGVPGGTATEIKPEPKRLTGAEIFAEMQKNTPQRLKKDVLLQLAATASQGPALKEEVDTEQSAAAVMQNISTSTNDEINRAVAERLKMLLGNTEVRLVDDLRSDDGQAVYGTAATDGSFIELDKTYGLNEQTALHEGVHAGVERTLNLPEDQLTPEQLAAKRELTDIYNALKEDKDMPYPELVTSLNEFAAEALTSPKLRTYMQSKPWTLKYMWDAFKSVILRLLGVKTPSNMSEAAIAAVDRLMTKVPRATEADMVLDQPRLNRVRDAEFDDIVNISNKMVARQKTWSEKIKVNATGLAFETQVVDRFAGFERLSKVMDKLKGIQMMYYLRMYDQRMNFVSQSAANGALQIVEKVRADGQKEYLIESRPGASLRGVSEILRGASDAMGGVDNASRAFTSYMAALRAKRVGLDKLNFSGTITQAELDRVLATVNGNKTIKDVFERAREEYNEYNRGLVNFAVSAGAIRKADAEALLKSNDYIPFYRERNGVVELMIGGENPIRIGNIKEQPYLQELVGGDTPIMDFMVSSVQNTNMMVDMALRNLATKNAVFELKNMNMAKITDKAISGPDVIKFKVDGEDRFAMVDTASAGVPADILVKGMEGIPTQMPFALRLLAAPASFLRKAVTSTPVYAARQLFRDSVASPLLSGADFLPVMGALRQIGGATKGTLESRGITGGQVFTGGAADITDIMRRIASGKSGWNDFVSKAESISMEADALTRRAQYNSYIKQGLSEMEATYMALESMNFTKRGASPSIHMANSLIPFFNAQIQSLNVLYKSLTGKMPFNERLKVQEKLLTRGLMIAAGTLAYAAYMQDDEAYKNATPEQKYGNWFVRIPGVEEAVRLPIPFEIGYIFKALPEALYNSMVNERGGEEAVKAFRQILLNTIPGGSSYGIPQAMRPAIEAGLGKSFYTGRDIMSPHEQKLLPEAQFRENTSQIAKTVGAAAGVSPIVLEQLVQGYTGSVGLAFLQAISMPFGKSESPEKAYKRLSEMPVVGTAFQPNDAGGIINMAYDRMNEFSKVKATVDDLLERGEKAKALEIINTKADQYAAGEIAHDFTSTMGELTQYERAIRASNLSSEEKRERLDQVRKIKIRYADTMRGAVDRTIPQ
jgi:hypothetical protein